MARFERAGETSVLNMLGRLEPSRAINPSDGTDPISLGLMPSVEGETPYLRPGPSPATFEALGTELEQQNQTVPSPGEYPTVDALRAAIEAAGIMPERWINLDSGQAMLDGQIILLSLDDSQKIMETLIDAFDRGMRERVLSLRMEYLHEAGVAREEMRPPDTEASLVRPVQGEGASQEPAPTGPPPSPDLQPVLPARPKRRRRVQPLSRREVRETPPTPEA